MQNRNTGSDMNCEGTITEKGRRSPKWRGVGLYLFLLAVQTVGTGILVANLIPIYRMLAIDFANYAPDPRTWWAIAGILLIQVAYWLRIRLQPPPPRIGSIVANHVVIFIARLTFVIVTASFPVMFFSRIEALRKLNYPPLRALAVLLIFFSIFCWTLEMEHLAKVLKEKKHETSETHRD